MKRSVKGTIAAALLLSSLSMGSSAMASSHDVVESHVMGTQVKDSGNFAVISESRFSPMAVQKPIDNVQLSNTYTNASFDIPSGYGWVKVYVKNDGASNIKVFVNDSSGSQLMYGEVKPGGYFSQISSTPWGTGRHTVGVSSPSGNDMQGYISVKLAQNQNEL
ncbi:hypothetical protein ABE237_11855 [Brevibacillus formosus]|uniref:hypothetical protein n=1 Tax=Brevibacillus formosus TaxID=54913 RepID=UPI0018CD6823|nr:hypothetical protein [Brevibacillus formosus]